jgi:ADP-heptose:LPS heptosyltransferase
MLRTALKEMRFLLSRRTRRSTINTKDDRFARRFIARGDVARDVGRFRDAAVLYGEALRLTPWRGDIHIQTGHMFKEAGEFARAEFHYEQAALLMPDSAELALQFGHFYKTVGRLKEAWAAYARAIKLAPGWDAPKAELAALRKSGQRDRSQVRQGKRAQPVIDPDELGPDGPQDGLKLATLYGKLAPELMPRSMHELLRYSGESIALRQFGVEQNTFWGHKQVARGVEAIRGVCISKALLMEVQTRVNGILIHRGPLKGPYVLEYEPDKNRIHKYVFNIWADFSDFNPGLYELELTIIVAGEKNRVFRQEFVVEEPLLEADYPDSDGVVTLPDNFKGSVEDYCNSRPSIIHEAERSNQIGEVRSILLCRSDQLGDLVASIPGILRTRELFPGAKLVGLVGAANEGLARSLGVFDDLVVVNHTENWHQRTRTLSLAEQEDLRAKLAPYKFDIAVDLSQSLMGRPLLALSGARFVYGFRDPGWPRLSASYDDAFFDPKNRREIAAHSKRVINMIDRLGALTRATAKVIRRDDLTRDRLMPYGIGPREAYAALHDGARIVWSRWPHHLQLASRLLEDTNLKVVLFTDNAGLRNNLLPDLAGSDRLIILGGELPFDDFDALLSFCAVFVGNDSGPKHLASLRGVPVVSIHSARLNWNEWGQEHTGVIISRKVPCAGCHIYHDPDECGKDYACMNIGFQEVYDAVRRYV